MFNKPGPWDSHVADEMPAPAMRIAAHFSQADYDRMLSAAQEERSTGRLAELNDVPQLAPDAPSGTIASGILREAADIVEGARGTTHGDKERSFEAIAGLWTAYLAARRDGGAITALDVAWMMNLLKIARSVQGTFIRDHATDAAGYAAIAGELGCD